MEYKSARLTFKRDDIEPLSNDDCFIIYVTNESKKYQMTKAQFYEVFDNVVSSKSHKDAGVYSYETTPSKAYKFII